jgi:hypothetical protein
MTVNVCSQRRRKRTLVGTSLWTEVHATDTPVLKVGPVDLDLHPDDVCEDVLCVLDLT